MTQLIWYSTPSGGGNPLYSMLSGGVPSLSSSTFKATPFGSTVAKPFHSCQDCGCTRVVRLTSQDMKICPGCGKENQWKLKPRQKSLL